MNALLAIACFASGSAGFLFCNTALKKMRVRALRRAADDRLGLSRPNRVREGAGLNALILRGWRTQSKGALARSRWSQRCAELIFGRRSRAWFALKGRLLGEGHSWQGLCAIRFCWALYGAAAAVVFFYALDAPLSGLAVGAFAASSVPLHAAQEAIREKSDELEKELPEMLSIVALGVKSGLSFERSFGLYAAHFDTPFSQDCSFAQERWTLGLATREEALHDLAAGYDSRLFEQAVEAMVRSLRFGTGLAENFDSLAREARAQYRAKREESVAKAPVKMLLPMGALILPALLLLVMGPVLLQMATGF